MLLDRDSWNQLAQPIAAVSSPVSEPENYPAERNQGKHSALPIASFQNPISPPPTEQTMANFEVDPTPWLLWGHHVIDGGPTRLPRLFYYPAQDPPQTHQAFCIAQVNPPPLPHDEAFWCDQVRDMLLGPLNRNIIEIQPTLFGVGLFQMSGPNATNALVQHGPYPLPPLHLNRSVHFIHADDAVNHRASQGFRNGWLMLLGIPPDYRNGLHIANAISSFRKFHSWNSMDPIECRALVFASF
jgi:hypothetical protein